METTILSTWLVSPLFLYTFIALGAVGVCLSLPRPRISPQLIGGVVVAAAFGGLFLYLASIGGTQPVFFYIFSLIAILSGVRVISHPRPVYAALYFIFTILSSSVLYLLLQAEFMAFALLIIYAGAILITYLFVIMLATQAPTEDQLEALSEYDSYSREPVVATALGFVMLAVLTGYAAKGVQGLAPRDAGKDQGALAAQMPRKTLEALASRGAFEVFQRPPVAGLEAVVDTKHNRVLLALEPSKLDAFEKRLADAKFSELFGGPDAAKAAFAAAKDELTTRRGSPFEKPEGTPTGDGLVSYVRVGLPAEAGVENVEKVGFALVARHPMALELAGVILLMAMLGAVVLARKQIEMGEAEKAAAAARGSTTLPGPRGYGDAA